MNNTNVMSGDRRESAKENKGSISETGTKENEDKEEKAVRLGLWGG